MTISAGPDQRAPSGAPISGWGIEFGREYTTWNSF